MAGPEIHIPLASTDTLSYFYCQSCLFVSISSFARGATRGTPPYGPHSRQTGNESSGFPLWAPAARLGLSAARGIKIKWTSWASTRSIHGTKRLWGVEWPRAPQAREPGKSTVARHRVRRPYRQGICILAVNFLRFFSRPCSFLKWPGFPVSSCCSVAVINTHRRCITNTAAYQGPGAKDPLSLPGVQLR